MIDHDIPGPMTMVKIDGAKIKRLREQQGLTQLYLATAVQVTTDTISRWENKRYPSIKKENGLKLAEALNVELEDILEAPDDHESAPEADETAKTRDGDETAVSLIAAPRRGRSIYLLAGLILILGVIGGIVAFTLWPPGKKTLTVQITRILPHHFTPGQPFPVLLLVSGAGPTPSSLIIRESPPDLAMVSATDPALPLQTVQEKGLKWLRKISVQHSFAYLLTPPVSGFEALSFQGAATFGSAPPVDLQIGGDQQLIASTFHWADSNRDNTISDQEILKVYDLYSGLPELGLDIDAIEELWLGSGYRFDQQAQAFQALD